MTFLAILGILFIVLMIGFLRSKQFKEFREETKSTSQSQNQYLNKQTINSSRPYYDTIKKLRTDGYYLLKGDNYIYVYAYLPNGQVAWFSEFTMGNSVAERILLAKSIHETIANPKIWANHTSIEGNEVVSVFKIENETKILRGKLKANGQLQVFKTYNDFDGQKVTEWSDYDFIKYGSY